MTIEETTDAGASLEIGLSKADKHQLNVTHQCVGTLALSNTLTFAATLRLEHEQYDPGSIRTTILLHEQPKNRIEPLWLHEPFEFHANRPDTRTFQLWASNSVACRGNEIHVQHGAYELDCTDRIIDAGTSLSMTIELTGGKVLRLFESKSYSYDGTISKLHSSEAPIRWEKDGVTYIALVRSVYASTRVADGNATIQIERPSLFCEWTATNEGTTIRQVVDNIETELSDILLLLGLASRESIDWYEISLRMPDGSEAVRRQSALKPVEVFSATDLLIEHKALEDGGFLELLNLLRQSANREVVRKVISFLIAAYRQPDAGPRFVLFFAALEAIVSLSKSSPPWPLSGLTRDRWKQLRDETQRAIQAFCAQHSIVPPDTDALKQKLGDLRRPRFFDRVVGALSANRVDTLFIWPESVGFEEGLRTTIGLRNRLVHQASVDSLLLEENLPPLQVLVETLLLKSLHWPDAKVGRFNDQFLRRMNRGVEIRIMREKAAKLRASLEA